MVMVKAETMPIRTSEDVVRVRQVARELAIAQGLSLVDQTKIVTAASELARNTLDHGGGGTVRLEAVNSETRRGLRLTFEDQGPGIPDVRSGAERRLHDWRGVGTGLERRQKAVE